MPAVLYIQDLSLLLLPPMTPDALPEISVEELHARFEAETPVVLLDVRQAYEYDIINLEGVLIPLEELSSRLNELRAWKNDEIIVHCRTGNKSAEAVELLRKNGFPKARNLKGGITAWAQKIDPSFPIY